MSFSQDHQALSYARKLTKASCCVSETTSRAKVTSAIFTKAQMAAAFSQQFKLISPVFCPLIALKLMYPQEGIVSGVRKVALPPVSCVSSKMLKPLQALASVCKTGMAVTLRGKWNEGGKRNRGSPRAPGLSGCPSGSQPGHTPLLQHVHPGRARERSQTRSLLNTAQCGRPDPCHADRWLWEPRGSAHVLRGGDAGAGLGGQVVQ